VTPGPAIAAKWWSARMAQASPNQHQNDMKPKNRHKLKLFRLGQFLGHPPRWLLINFVGNIRTYKTYKRARQAMSQVVWIAYDE
jgi:hypothetical protein